MIRFTKEEQECRGRMVGSYFGDDKVKACGICDNCLRVKSVTLSREEFESIQSAVMALLKKNDLPARELIQQLNGIKKEKAWKVIDFLQAENKIIVDRNGLAKVAQ
jgi:ATP-dependent DNA helicase RecQ